MVADQIETLQEKLNWHWRNSMRPIRFFAFDARAAATLPLLFVYARLSTLLLTIVVLILFRYLERKGLTVPAALRASRSWINGRDRPGWLAVQRKRFADYG